MFRNLATQLPHRYRTANSWPSIAPRKWPSTELGLHLGAAEQIRRTGCTLAPSFLEHLQLILEASNLGRPTPTRPLVKLRSQSLLTELASVCHSLLWSPLFAGSLLKSFAFAFCVPSRFTKNTMFF